MGRAQPGAGTAGARILRRAFWLALLASMIAAATAASSASAISTESFGINISHNDTPPDLTGGYPGSAGVGMARREVISDPSWITATPNWSSSDPVVTTLWKAGVRLAPVLGLPCPSSQPNCQWYWNESPSQSAIDMTTLVANFAKRYGPGGTFWAGKTNPRPVELYEIGNEANLPHGWAQDDTHLHWRSDPSNDLSPACTSCYAQVYQAARSSLHTVNASLEAVVGGLADSGSLGVDLNSAEAILGAITGPVDAVGFHPYTWQTNHNFDAMKSDVVALREYMNAHGMGSTPIQLDEFDACSGVGQGCNDNSYVVTSSWWGGFVADYTTWALCTPGLGVQNVAPFTWGDTSETTNFQLLVDSSGHLTPYGSDYLNTVHTLETTGCPPLPPIPPGSGGSGGGGSGGYGGGGAVSGAHTALLKLLHVHVHGSYVTVVIRVTYGSYGIKVIAVRGHHRIRFHIIRRRRHSTLLTLTAKLFGGKWKLNLSCTPPSGYAAARRLHHLVHIR